MRKDHTRGRRIAAMLLLLFLAVIVTGCAGRNAQPENKPVELILFHNNPCESCDEEGQFRELLKEKANGCSYTVTSYYIYGTVGSEKLEEVVSELGIDRTDLVFPLVVADSRYLMGKSRVTEGIGDFVRGVTDSAQPKEAETGGEGQTGKASEAGEVSEADGASEADEASKTGKVSEAGNASEADEASEAVAADDRSKEFSAGGVPDRIQLLFFSTLSCSNCEKAWEYLGTLPEHVNVEGREYPLDIINLSVAEDDNALFFSDLARQYNVPESEQKVPVLFLGDRWLAGENSIRKDTWELLMKGSGLGSTYQASVQEKDSGESNVFFLLKTLGVGFLNGFNPCALSIVLLFLSLLATMKEGFLKYSIAFLIGKFVAYVLMGIAVSMAVSAVSLQAFTVVRNVINVVLILFCIVLAVGNLLDCYHAFRGEYGRIRVQLPRVLRRFNDRTVRAILNPAVGRLLLLVVFAGSMLIAVGEFFCTGQIYLASILQWLTRSLGGVSYLTFVLYCTALCLPSAIITVMVNRGKSAMALADGSLKRMPWIKLANALLFLVFAAFSLYMLR